MSEPFIGEIRVFAGNFAPVGWAFCDGRLLSIAEYEVVYVLLGTTYGGDGITTFGVPDLQGRSPIHQGTLSGGGTYTMGQKAGTETVTLTTGQLPAHTHQVRSAATASSTSPANARWAPQAANAYSDAAATTTLAPASVQATGGNLPHENMPPFLVLNYIICLNGIFPSQG